MDKVLRTRVAALARHAESPGDNMIAKRRWRGSNCVYITPWHNAQSRDVDAYRFH
jgi:hypothetical protein